MDGRGGPGQYVIYEAVPMYIQGIQYTAIHANTNP